MSRFPSIPLSKQTEKNVKLFLDSLAGRMNVLNRAITIRDLVETGVVTFKEGVTVEDITENTDPDDVLQVPGVPTETPSVPVSLNTAGSFGAIFLTWDYAGYNGEAGTEIWRSPAPSGSPPPERSTAVLIAVAQGRSYTDNVGQEETYAYWIRNRNVDKVVSGFNQLGGTQGSSNMAMSAEEFLIKNPEAEFIPFSVYDQNEGVGTPNWVLLLNGEVIITSNLSIGQLLTGELASDVKFTIGNSSIEMGTTQPDSLGYIQVAGPGGIVGNDYMRITDGNIQSFVYDPNINEHVVYKTLRRVERGTTQGGALTLISPYFKSPPIVYLFIEDISTYNKDRPDANQSLLLNVGPVTATAGVLGGYQFTPTAVLQASSGTVTEVESIDIITSNETAQAISGYTFDPCEGASFNFTLGSTKSTTGGDWQNRRITVYVDGALNAGVYNQIGTDYVDLTGDGVTQNLVIQIPTLTSGSWVFRYRFVASDITGTTPGTGTTYDYANDNSTVGNTGITVADLNNESVSTNFYSTRPVRDASWTLFEIDYAAVYDVYMQVWGIKSEIGSISYNVRNGYINTIIQQSSSSAFNKTLSANAGNNDQPPNGVCNGYPTVLFGDGYQEFEELNVDVGTNGKISITDNDPTYLAGKFTNTLSTLRGDSYNGEVLAGGVNCDMGTGKTTFEIKSFNVTYYYRRPLSQSTTPVNRFKVDSVTANLGVEDLTVGTSTINWLALGE